MFPYPAPILVKFIDGLSDSCNCIFLNVAYVTSFIHSTLFLPLRFITTPFAIVSVVVVKLSFKLWFKSSTSLWILAISAAWEFWVATIGANAVILEGIKVGKGAVVAAGSVVIEDVPEGVVVAGSPAKIIKAVDDKTKDKTQILDDLRK